MKDIKSYNELDDNEKVKRNKLGKNIFDIMVILGFGMIIGFIILAVKIEKENPPEYQEYMIVSQHTKMIEENSRYKYCPYCGESLMDTDKGE